MQKVAYIKQFLHLIKLISNKMFTDNRWSYLQPDLPITNIFNASDSISIKEWICET